MIRVEDIVTAYELVRQLNETQRKIDGLDHMPMLRVVISRDSVNRYVFSYKEPNPAGEELLTENQNEEIRSVVLNALKQKVDDLEERLKLLGVKVR